MQFLGTECLCIFISLIKYLTIPYSFTFRVILFIQILFRGKLQKSSIYINGVIEWEGCYKKSGDLYHVGIYKNGQWWSFTHKPNMARTVTGDGEDYDEDIGESDSIPTQGVMFGARGYNIAYWVDNDKDGRFFVRNYDTSKNSNGGRDKCLLDDKYSR